MHANTFLCLLALPLFQLSGGELPLPVLSIVKSGDQQRQLTITPVRLPTLAMYRIMAEGDYMSVHKLVLDPVALVAWGKMETLKEGAGYETSWIRPLDIKISPLGAFVHNAGFVLLLGDWPGIVAPDSVLFVLYGPRGTLIKTATFREVFSEKQMKHLERSDTGVWWKSIQTAVWPEPYVSGPFVAGSSYYPPAASIIPAIEVDGIGEDIIEIKVLLAGPDAGKILFVKGQ